MALSRLAFAALLAAAHSPAFGAAHLTGENFVGNPLVENAASATEITARVEPGAGAVPAPLVSGGGLALVIDGGFDVDSVRCGAGNVPAVEIGGDAVSIGRLPVVRVRAPIDVDVVITASAPFGAIGEVSNLVLAVEGCAVFNAGVVRDLLEARIDGGGALRVRRAEDAVIRTRGTVELTVGEVVRTARIDLEGRGNPAARVLAPAGGRRLRRHRPRRLGDGARDGRRPRQPHGGADRGRSPGPRPDRHRRVATLGRAETPPRLFAWRSAD